MPWKECHVVDERVRFVRRLLDGETMAALCTEFGISRKTGYKIFQRYQQIGVRGLSDRSRRPYRHANQLPQAVETLIVRLKKDYPTWGAPKIRERLRQRWPDIPSPAISTVHAVLDRHGLVTHRRRRRRPRLTGTPLTAVSQPNNLWCADYKGEFLLRNQRYCYPLTITDYATRYLLACEALSTTQERYAFSVFERAFQDFGLPEAIRTDNGVPFASAHALYGLSKLAVWWLRLGIRLERIAPGHPEQNGRHERMHLTLKTDATRPAAHNVLQQQMRFDAFVHRFNQERPAPGARHGHTRQPLHRVATPLPGARGAGLPVSRLDRRRHALRPHLLPAAQDQSESGVCGAEGRREADRRAHLARQLHGLRLGILRR
jgi:putative transposase